MPRKRLLGALREARERLGDVKLSAAEARLSRAQAGAPRKWDASAHRRLYVAAQELLRAGAKSEREALAILRQDYGCSLPTLQREYKRARELVEDVLGLHFSPHKSPPFSTYK
jgi:hypothetical protein